MQQIRWSDHSQGEPGSVSPLLLRIVGDLYDAGARAGDPTESTSEPFLPWKADTAEALTRLAAEAEPHSRSRGSGDVCWFAVP
ncbi:hypothetical protein [Streptomyces xanthophaeus]|uniref:hypothetical protein n=1 Tax=Streptomyces xanthophaeus TaxID=67385 RepID=UPI00264709C2|nr:hypothetical protein [Streptomyces xanthophaeus]WKD32140.1 hypothetical protein KO717_09385 [Streptomyces xanthophaeus]